ncbi:protein-L-isoaspartate O-methyltransferase [bacterium]|nr:protein-L-isoaspartate O-methyltransferase [bacterium]
MDIVGSLVEDGWLRTPRIIKAFRKIRREDFMPLELKNAAEVNEAFPIGLGQTISQPLTVGFMLELLQPKEGDKVLDIGSGSGWTSALLAEIVGERGKVIGVEIIPALAEFGKKNIAKYNFIKRERVQIICGDGSKGYVKEAPYDKILCSASAKSLPEPWKEQLKINGRIVAPIGSSVWLFVKKSSKEFKSSEYPNFSFVPLVQ